MVVMPLKRNRLQEEKKEKKESFPGKDKTGFKKTDGG